MSKEALLEQAWAGTFVSEASLSTVINELRAALQDDAREPRFIRTVYGFGYAFIAPVRQPSRLAEKSDSDWRLVHERRVILLKAGTNIVGRSDEATVIFDVPGVSRHHATLFVDGDQVRIEDLGSKNGTWLGRTLVTGSTSVNDGDELRFGPVVAVLHHVSMAHSTETITPPY